MTLSTTDIFLPVIALILWTLVYAACMGIYRFRAVKEGAVDPRIFRTYRDKSGMTDTMLKMSNHYDNLLQMPIVFYVVCILIYVTQRVDEVFIVLAWLFLAARVVHSFIHLGKNNTLYRFLSFGISVLILLILLIRWAVKIAA